MAFWNSTVRGPDPGSSQFRSPAGYPGTMHCATQPSGGSTNLGFEQWPSALGASSQVTPALDRLIEGAHIITFPSDAASYRAERKQGPGPLAKKGGRRR